MLTITCPSVLTTRGIVRLYLNRLAVRGYEICHPYPYPYPYPQISVDIHGYPWIYPYPQTPIVRTYSH